MNLSFDYREEVTVYLHHAEKNILVEVIPGSGGGIRDQTIMVGNLEIVVFVDREEVDEKGMGSQR